tara:strand:- start:6902 stop:7576 length:675 start_codon:yes stop_codon:yes gene_type:complete
MHLEYEVEVLKYKLQKFLIDHKKDYDKFVKEWESDESYSDNERGLKEKQKALDNWLKGWDKQSLFNALTKVETRFVIEEGWFWDKVVEDKYLVSGDFEDLPRLPEGLYWRERNYLGMLNVHRCIHPSDLFKSGNQNYIFRETKVLHEIDLCNFEVEEGTLPYVSNKILHNSGVFEIYAKTLAISPYNPPFNIEQLLEKVLLAEKSGAEKVVLEENDLEVLKGVI